MTGTFAMSGAEKERRRRRVGRAGGETGEQKRALCNWTAHRSRCPTRPSLSFSTAPLTDSYYPGHYRLVSQCTPLLFIQKASLIHGFIYCAVAVFKKKNVLFIPPRSILFLILDQLIIA